LVPGSGVTWSYTVSTPSTRGPDALRTSSAIRRPEAAIATRRRILDRAAARELIVAGAHLPFPGMARIVRDGDRLRYVPEDLCGPLAARGDSR